MALLIIAGILVSIAVIAKVVASGKSKSDSNFLLLEQVARKWNGAIDAEDSGVFFEFSYGHDKVKVSYCLPKDSQGRYNKAAGALYCAAEVTLSHASRVPAFAVCVKDETFAQSQGIDVAAAVFMEDIGFRQKFIVICPEADFALKLLAPKIKKALLLTELKRALVRFNQEKLIVQFHVPARTESEYDKLIDLALAVRDQIREMGA